MFSRIILSNGRSNHWGASIRCNCVKRTKATWACWEGPSRSALWHWQPRLQPLFPRFCSAFQCWRWSVLPWREPRSTFQGRVWLYGWREIVQLTAGYQRVAKVLSSSIAFSKSTQSWLQWVYSSSSSLNNSVRQAYPVLNITFRRRWDHSRCTRLVVFALVHAGC